MVQKAIESVLKAPTVEEENGLNAGDIVMDYFNNKAKAVGFTQDDFTGSTNHEFTLLGPNEEMNSQGGGTHSSTFMLNVDRTSAVHSEHDSQVCNTNARNSIEFKTVKCELQITRDDVL